MKLSFPVSTLVLLLMSNQAIAEEMDNRFAIEVPAKARVNRPGNTGGCFV